MSSVKFTSKHRIRTKNKFNMYRVLVVSTLFCGSESWSTTLADRRLVEVFDMRCQRRLLRVFWQQHISNQSIRERTKQPTASSLLRQRHSCWFGYVIRMASFLTVRVIYHFDPNILPTLESMHDFEVKSMDHISLYT